MNNRHDEWLREGGISADAEVDVIIERIKRRPANEAMQDRWSDTMDGYPSKMLAVLRIAVNNEAVAWIDEHCPQAWFRAVFAGGMSETRMTNVETAAWLREWVKQGGDKRHGIWNWPTDACGYDQHIRFVQHRNENWRGGDFDQFVLDYADMIEKETEQ